MLFELLLLAPALLADGPTDNLADRVRPVPPPGVEVPAADRKELESSLETLGKAIAGLESSLAGKPLAELLPDVRVLHRAVHVALAENEIFDLKELGAARELLRLGKERAEQLAQGLAPWVEAPGLVVRGYVSRIDGSVQPYGLVVPSTFRAGSPHRHRLDFWFHGRGETLSELNFLAGRLRSPGEFSPPDTIVLHLYGRYCCANKLAGEVDLFEALESVKQRYAIDEDRLVVRGFSMGGAACWQFAVHYADRWAAAAPGAGFAETPEFLRIFQKEAVKPLWWERRLWHLYDCTDSALNLYHCPTVAYSGTRDTQKQAADIMASALAKEGIELTHVLGPDTGHSYHPAARAEINARIDAIVALGRERFPRRVKLTTWTLRYNRMHWVLIDGLQEHWTQARVEAEVTGPSAIQVKTSGVTALTLDFPPGCPLLEVTSQPAVEIDGARLAGPRVQSDRSYRVRLTRAKEGWKLAGGVTQEVVAQEPLRKRHGLQGPIDDAFLDSFLFVFPSGKSPNERVQAWVEAESARAVKRWRSQFRGDVRVVQDSALTEEQIRSSHLVLWGDPSSNRVLARIAEKLPIRWSPGAIEVSPPGTGAPAAYPAASSVLLLVFPNPLEPGHYVVLNSGFTYREYDDLNNARQVPRLPDWAVVDLSEPPSSRFPGKLVAGGFFDESWALPPGPLRAPQSADN